MKITPTLTAGMLLCASITGCGSTESVPPVPNEIPHTEAYVPTWLSPVQNERIAQVAPRLGGVTIAFALPERSGRISPPTIEDLQSFKRIIGALPAKATVRIAVGGWGGDDAAHQQILEGFKNGARHPQKFASQTAEMMSELGQKVGREIDGVDLDWEYPTGQDAANFGNLLTTLHEQMPDKAISIAAPAYDTAESAGITVALEQAKVRDSLDRVHVMTYDQHGPWDKTAGVVASGKWAKESIDSWVQKVGAEKVSPGYAAYCYEYVGAQKQGQTFTGSKEHAFSELPKDTKVIDNLAALTSSTKLNGNWASCQSPAVVKTLDHTLRQTHPDLKAGFFWDANGVTPEYLSK